MPTFPDSLPILVNELMLFVFGLGFNKLVEWMNREKIMPVSISVVIGVAMTITVPTVLFRNMRLVMWQSSIIYFMSFMASGSPMIFGNVLRYEKDRKKARKLGKHAAELRDMVVMDIKATIERIVKKEAEVLDVVHSMHEWIGTLKSL